MKFRKPSAEKLMGHSEVVDFYDSLPSEFEILGPGESAVRWPRELTKESILRLADTSLHGMNPMGMAVALRALAAIAPERKKLKVNLWRFLPEGELELKPTDWAPFAHHEWRKVAGPIEIDD